MSSRSTAALALSLPRDALGDELRARLRFEQIVRALADVVAVRRPASAGDEAARVDHLDMPTRRLNRLQRLFGRLRRRPMQGGKSRRHTR